MRLSAVGARDWACEAQSYRGHHSDVAGSRPLSRAPECDKRQPTSDKRDMELFFQ